MERKKKVCTGFNGIQHEDYIYKNIKGKKYCKSCTYKLQPPKSINKFSEKGMFKLKIKQTEQHKDNLFYLNEVWYSRYFTKALKSDGERYMHTRPRCENCGKGVQTSTDQDDFPLAIWFHHILPKAKFPQFRYKEWNMAILCENCHNQVEIDIDKTPKIKEKRDQLLKKIQNQ